ncbi:MAG TPA: phosphotransferase [Candidatus Baltobacteraceae bacterium]|nr:phosphotransferase [Candidatus Baltobacteraceae bacterium]
MPAWTPEIPVDEDLAKRLVRSQFPQFERAHVRRIGAGWDNAAYLVDEHLVFRFPQRAVAAPLIERENFLLPLLAPQLPIPIPTPRFVGVPAGDYPWAFAGYEILAGVSACTRVPNDDERRVLAQDLARFLRALHDVHPEPLREAGLPQDLIGRLDPARLKIDDEPLAGPRCVVHGDLYARHLLLDADKRLSGIIDWGDLHFGHAAVDLMAIHQMVPPHHHDAFFEIYGPVDERSWRFARSRAMHHMTFVEEYTKVIDDPALRSMVRIARENLGVS